ncbi:hypothetical protein BB558_001007 [Smittium angustum]|uniref:Uncharacterized protein n=1 Tax=Smittium angustum TaxID=133377 RepID=A0A2U1JCK0_SMIAN|nr:hypothetical protein BB558_001007 [Smittium angustum]
MNEKQKRIVYKPTLNNPTTIEWPSSDPKTQKPIFDKLLELLEPIPKFRKSKLQKTKNLKRKNSKLSKQIEKKSRNEARSSTKPNLENEIENETESQPETIPEHNLAVTTNSENQKKISEYEEPQWFSEFTIGLNNVTKELEALVKFLGNPKPDKKQKGHNPPDCSVVFVCYNDAEPKHMVSHLPALVHLINQMKSGVQNKDSSKTTQKTFLVSLPPGSECMLSMKLDIKRVLAISIHANSKYFEELVSLVILNTSVVNIPWIMNLKNDGDSTKEKTKTLLEPMKIKYIQTTMPIANKKSKS